MLLDGVAFFLCTEKLTSFLCQNSIICQKKRKIKFAIYYSLQQNT